MTSVSSPILIMSPTATTSTSASPQTASAPHRVQGGLLKHWRNEVKVQKEYVSKVTGIDVHRLEDLERGKTQATFEELNKLAKCYVVSLRDLLPAEYDLERGVKILRHKNARVIPQNRGGRLQYTYWERAMTSTLPNFKPVELELHLHDRESVVLNHGHFFHQYTQVLHGGPVSFLWKEGEKTHEEICTEGDSWLIPGFVPHGFYSPEAQNGRILAITFGQHLASGDARAEMALIGGENLPRIISDEDYYKV